MVKAEAQSDHARFEIESYYSPWNNAWLKRSHSVNILSSGASFKDPSPPHSSSATLFVLDNMA